MRNIDELAVASLPPDNLLSRGSESQGTIRFSSASRDLAFFLPRNNSEAPTRKPSGPIGSGRPSEKNKNPEV